MSVVALTLFISSTSQASNNCIGTINKYGFGRAVQMQIVRLDTEEARKRAARGKDIQVVSVPTLVIELSDGNNLIRRGSQEVLQFLSQLNRPEPIQESEPMEDPPREKKKKKGKKKQLRVREPEPEPDPPEEEEDPIEVIPPRKTKKHNTKYAQMTTNPKQDRMGDIHAMARQMAAERKETLNKFGGNTEEQ